jgi:hyperosmotically inducible periplasmic protein
MERPVHMRTMLRGLLVIALLLVVAFIALRYSTDAPWLRSMGAPGAARSETGTAAETAKQRGSELGEKAAIAAEAVGNAVDDAATTAKIKAKMALDDSVQVRSVDVSTTGPTVTLSGTVRSLAERDRCVTLARETHGVTRVVDHLVVANR